MLVRGQVVARLVAEREAGALVSHCWSSLSAIRRCTFRSYGVDYDRAGLANLSVVKPPALFVSCSYFVPWIPVRSYPPAACQIYTHLSSALSVSAFYAGAMPTFAVFRSICPLCAQTIGAEFMFECRFDIVAGWFRAPNPAFIYW